MLALVLLFLLSAFFSSSETAFISLNRLRIKRKIKEGNKKAELIDRMLENPQKLITTILIGNNLVNIAAASIATSIAIKVYGNLGVGIATGVMTLLILIFGEIVPKSFAVKNAEKIAYAMAQLLSFFEKLFYPITYVLILLTNAIIGKENKDIPLITEEELRTAIEVSVKEGVLEKEERDLLRNAFDFGDKTVSEIMIPRIDIVMLSSDKSIKDALNLVVKKGHSRIPVYSKDKNNIIGMIYSKDILKAVAEGKRGRVKDLIRPVLYVPESKKLDDLLREMKQNKTHLAIVVNEYGDVEGLVTMEDLIEELVGEIDDEYDTEEIKIMKISSKEYLVSGRTTIKEINKELKLNLEESEEYDTLAGYILHHLERIPFEGEKIKINNITYVIEKMEGNKIKFVRILLR